MAIDFQCPRCRKDFSVNDRYAGTQARCSCGAAVTIPTQAAAENRLEQRGALRENITDAFAAPAVPQPAQALSPSAVTSRRPPIPPEAAAAMKVNKGVYIGAFLGGCLSFWALYCFITPRVVNARVLESRLFMLLPITSWIMLTCGIIFWALLLHRMWASIQNIGAGATPGEAVAFVFVPFYNLYWLFQVYWGWTQDYNRAVIKHSVIAPKMPEALAITVSITTLLCCIPHIFKWVFLGHIFLMGIFFIKACDGINALIDSGVRPKNESYGAPNENARTSKMVVSSLFLGICGIFTAGVAAIVGLVLAMCGLRAVGKSAGRLKGEGAAAAGIVACAFTTILGILIAIPVVVGVRREAARLYCATNMKKIAGAFRVYADRHDGELPVPAVWCDQVFELGALGEKVFRCKSGALGRCDYAMNKNLERAGAYIPGDIVVLFESKPGWNQAGGPEMLNTENHQGRGCNIVFGDGSIIFVFAEHLSKLRWRLRPAGIITEVASAAMHIRNATACLDAGRYRAAVEEFDKAIEIDAENSEALYLRGLAHFNIDNHSEAIRDYTAAILINDKYVEAHGSRAMAYFQMKLYDKAWADVQTVQRLGAEVSPDFMEELYKASKREKAE